MSSPSPTSIRTFSARAPSPARASTTSMPWRRRCRGESPRTRCSATTFSKARCARSALVTDVEVVEDYPTRYSVDASRQHRWARGDWQLLRLHLRPAVRRSGAVALEDDRQSAPLADADLLGAGGDRRLDAAAVHPGRAMAGAADPERCSWRRPSTSSTRILPKSLETTARGHFSALVRDAVFGTAMVALRIVLMAHSAWMMGDAIVRTLYRLFVSRKNLLEWRTASQAHKSAATTCPAYYRMMYGAVVIALIGLAIPVAADSTGAFVAFFFAIFWAGSPAFAWLISRSAETEDRLRMSPADDRQRCAPSPAAPGPISRPSSRPSTTCCRRTISRRSPRPVVAPTAPRRPISASICCRSCRRAISAGSAWPTPSSASKQTMTTIETHGALTRPSLQLVRHQTLLPLYPLYVSSVDSGNLAGHLIAVARRLRRMGRSAVGASAGRFRRPARLRRHPRGEPGRSAGRPPAAAAAAPAPARPHRGHAPRRRDDQEPAGNGVDPHDQSQRARRRNPQAGRRHPHRSRARRAARSSPTGRASCEATCEAHVQDAHSDDDDGRRAARQADRHCASARANSPSRWTSPSCCGRSASCCRSATGSRSTSSTRAATTCSPPKRG